MKELANACGLDRSTSGGNLPVLEKKKLITIQSLEDVRTRQIELTTAGMKACNSLAIKAGSNEHSIPSFVCEQY